MKTAFAASAALLLASCVAINGEGTPAGAPGDRAWAPVGDKTGSITDKAQLEALSVRYPDSASVRLRLLSAQLKDRDEEGAITSLSWLYARNYVFGNGGKAQIVKALAGADTARVEALLRAPADVIARSTLLRTIPAEAGLIESVWVDPQYGRLLATSVTGRAVWGDTPSGAMKGIAQDGAGNLSGIAYDETNDRIWVASGNIDGSDNAERTFSGLIALTALGAAPMRAAAPDGANISDIAVAQNGAVYASDPLAGGIYVLRPGEERMAVMVAPGTFRSPQGLATSEAGDALYVSDYRYGLARVDLATGRVDLLAGSAGVTVPLDGIDGLWRYGNTLIAMQNGSSPMRILALDLDPTGRRILRSRTIEQAHPEWSEPLGGSIHRGHLVYVADGQWDVYDQHGQVREGKQPRATHVRSVPLD